MVFPATKLPVKVELQLGGTWTDVTPYTYLRDRIQIVRGRRDESGSFEPSECQLTFNNRGGRFSPRNPTGPYYGLLGRNAPVRVSVLVGGTRLVTSAPLTEYAETPDSAGLSITGDIDLRADVYQPNWREGGRFIRKFLAGQFSYILDSNTDGTLVLFWSADGTAGLSATSTVPVPISTGRTTVRATLDVDNGAAGRTITFYTGTSVNGPWTQLGSPVVQAGVTSIFDGTATVRSPTLGDCKTYALKILQGIGGTERANPDFTAQSEGATSFADAAGNTWTLIGTTTALTARRYRFYGEIPSWPQSWDISENDVWTSITAAGILRRLGQGTAPLKGTIQRAVAKDATVQAYWPMEDAQGSTTIASGLPGGPSMVIVGNPELASSTVFAATNPLPVVAQAGFFGGVNAYTSTNIIHAHILMAVPTAGETDGAIILRLGATGTAARWDVAYASAGNGALNILAYDALGANILTSGAAFAVNGKLLILVIELVQNGANIDWKLLTVATVDGAGLQWTGTLNTRTVGAAVYIQANPTQVFTDTVMGHLTVASAVPASLEPPLRGYTGETAGRRIERLCSEEGITFTAFGELDASEAMGAQKPGQLLDLFAECETTDLGQLFESRDNLGLAYRTRRSRVTQAPTLALNYNALRELAPVEDDQATRNDITVSRIDGSSARATLDVGTLSTQAPPNGVGRYDDEVELSLATDAQCPQQASWRLAAGTVDEPRYPTLGVELAGTAFAASQALITSAIDLDCGDRITVTGTPVWLPPEDIDQHVVGYSETLGVRDYPIDYVCQPATPTGSAGLYDNAAFRWAADSSTLTGGITSSALSASVATASGPLWTTAGGDFPLDVVIAGERITVSAISGASSPQTFTFSARGVNGVTKAQSSGAAVQIVDPVQYAL